MRLREHESHASAPEGLDPKERTVFVVEIAEDGGIEFVILQAVQLSARREIEETDFCFGMALAKFADGRDDEVIQHRADEAEAHGAGGSPELLPELLRGGLRIADDLTGFCQEETPGFREFDALSGALEKFHAEFIFKVTHLPAEWRL